jgi:parallel beta helix pectate lyase-like protein/pectate lyase-like protein
LESTVVGSTIGPMTTRSRWCCQLSLLLGLFGCASLAGAVGCSRTHGAEGKLVTVTVGHHDADVIGDDNRAIQKAIERVAAAGAGVVLVKAGTYTLYNTVRLASHVTLRGEGPERTLLKKGPGVASALGDDADFGESQATVEDASGFVPGMGVAVTSKEYPGDLPSPVLYGYVAYPSSLRTIVRIEGKTLFFDHYLQNDYKVEWGGRVANAFPLVAGYNVEDAIVEELAVDGNGKETESLQDRMGAIYFLNSKRFTVRNCLARNFAGDGINFQFIQDFVVDNCESFGNAIFGMHFGTGALRGVARHNRIHNNGEDGLYLCYRVQHGRFEDNASWANGQDGISLGYKDTDNTFLRNTVRENGRTGIYFRNESKMAFNTANRNTLRDNLIVDNGPPGKPGYGVWISSSTRDVVLESNTIRETRTVGRDDRHVGIYVGPQTDYITCRDNILQGVNPAILDESKNPHNMLEQATNSNRGN